MAHRHARPFDAIVVGVGGMGSAAVYHLARRGKRVLGLERFDIPHDMGSSHGVTRIIRLAYYEHPSYVPLLRRAYELWRELERLAGEQLLHITGSIDAGPPDGAVFEGSLQSCAAARPAARGADRRRARPPLPRLSAAARTTLAVLQPEGGFLLPERCIVAHVAGAPRRWAPRSTAASGCWNGSRAARGRARAHRPRCATRPTGW